MGKAVQSILNLKYGEWYMFALLPIHLIIIMRVMVQLKQLASRKQEFLTLLFHLRVLGCSKGSQGVGPPSSFSAEVHCGCCRRLCFFIKNKYDNA